MHESEELQHYGAYAVEESRPRCAFQLLGQWRRDHTINLWCRVHLLFLRREQNVDAFTLQTLAIGFERARITVEVLVRPELQPVNENAGDDRVAVFLSDAHELQMALVQIAHRRHERDSTGIGKKLVQLGGSGRDLHAFKSPLDGVFGGGEATVLDGPDVRLNGLLNARAARHEIADEARRPARVDAEHIVEHEYLATASRTGADADCGQRDVCRKLGRERGRNHLEHDEIRTGDGKRVGILAQYPRRRLGLALRLVAAEPMHRLGLQAQVTAHGDAARDQKLDA